ncbi:recombinase family protein [Streptomyces sp. 5.8]|uniref:recombinase family protein n=1 Tax=Streptomyces sp. 5.8 TaxID=3406571 RepID=UPI003BB5F3E2
MTTRSGSAPVRAAIYARISQDRTGDALGVERQEAECRTLCERLGFEVGGVFRDNDLSATKRGVARPGFEALLVSRPEAIVVWHTDRLVRVTRDLERVIGLGANVHALHAGHLDLSTPAGRAVARTVTAWTQYEGEQKALRQVAANVQAAQLGKPYTAGIRPFGYAADHLTIVQKEAEAIQRGARLIVDGESLSAVARVWNDAGLISPRSRAQTTKAEGWTLRGVKQVLTSPRYIGQRTYRGEVMGRANWPAILDEATHDALLAILNDPKRFSGGARTGRTPQTLLSGIALCGVCGETVSARGYRGAKVYGCRQTHTRTPREIAEERATTATLERLNSPDFALPIRQARASHGEASGQLHAEAQSLRERLDGLAVAYAEGHITLSQMTAGSDAVKAKLEEAEAKMSRVTGLPLIDPVHGLPGLIADWACTPLPVRRAWVQFVTAVTLNPAQGRHALKMASEDHVSVQWKYVSSGLDT